MITSRSSHSYGARGLPAPIATCSLSSFPVRSMFSGYSEDFSAGVTRLPFMHFDALLVIAFGVILSLWSRRLFGRIAPGLIGYSFFLYYYLGLDYHLAAQRDWHAAFFALLGLLLPDIVVGRRGRIASGAAFGLSLVFRPQMLLLLPALCQSLDQAPDRSGDQPARRYWLSWNGQWEPPWLFSSVFFPWPRPG